MIGTSNGGAVERGLVLNYFAYLINHFYKILPMREQAEDTLHTYLQSFQLELLGFASFLPSFRCESTFLTLLSILQYFIDHPEASVAQVKREVFRAISICVRLKERYEKEGMV